MIVAGTQNRALIRLYKNKKIISISVAGEDVTKWDFLALIRKILDTIHRNFGNISVLRMIPVSGNGETTELVDFDQLINAWRQGQTEFTPRKVKKFQIHQVLEGYALTEEVPATGDGNVGQKEARVPKWKILAAFLSCSVVAAALGFFLPFFFGNEPPVACISPDFTIKNVFVNETVYFNATNSTDPDGDDTIVQYEWFIDGKHYSNEERFHYTFVDTLSHPIKLVVTDNKGRKSDTSIEIQAQKK